MLPEQRALSVATNDPRSFDAPARLAVCHSAVLAFVKEAGCESVLTHHHVDIKGGRDVYYISPASKDRVQAIVTLCFPYYKNGAADPAAIALVQDAVGLGPLTEKRRQVLRTELTMRYQDSGL